MALTDAERAKRYRDRQRGGPPRQLVPHGTLAAHRRHQTRGEAPCEECRRVRNAYIRDLRATQKRMGQR